MRSCWRGSQGIEAQSPHERFNQSKWCPGRQEPAITAEIQGKGASEQGTLACIPLADRKMIEAVCTWIAQIHAHGMLPAPLGHQSVGVMTGLQGQAGR